jgi:outer membrane protein assembly factor BamD (BamD/ComL family)
LQSQRTRVKRIVTSTVFLSVIFFLNAFGQEGISYDLTKPEKYENRTLGYEKTENTKFKVPRRFVQNTITHYNFYYNTNIKLNEIVNRAKSQFRDNFNKLLPFYNYSLETTARDKRNLDSVIDKVNTAILVRDLRNDWADNLYMLMGQAYFYKNNLDSAHVLFQFVNYAFAPKEKDGYPLPIGSNENADDGGNAFTISTSEKRNIVKRSFSLPPSRNESFVWQIRTFLMRDDLIRAAVLIDILKHDPNFPERLQSALEEVQAFWYYKQANFDSAALHLIPALDNAATQAERARWEYLIAQLFERSNKPALAKSYYEKAASHTLDPVMEVYARLNAIRQNKGSDAGADYIRKNIDALQRMARKELYAPYLDIIFYAAGEMELERNNYTGAKVYFKKSIAHSNSQSSMRDEAFLKLGWLSLDEKKYPEAKHEYDSINTNNPLISDSLQLLLDRKQALNHVVPQILIIERQDSLQRIASMTEEERNAFIKKMIRAIRKQQGLSEEEQQGSNGYGFKTNATNADMFNDNSSGEWYFYNLSLKSKGYNEFRSKWGIRPNADFWQVQSMIAKQKSAATAPGGLNSLNGAEGNPAAASQAALTPQMLLQNLPLTPEKWKKSQDSMENALFTLGKGLQDYIPDYSSAIRTYDSLESRFPTTRFFQEALFNTYYCYQKLNDTANAARILALMKQKFPSGRYVSLIENPPSGSPDQEIRTRATHDYEKIYEDLIEGNFDQALAEKKKQDSVYGDKYWTPQLLYVEALYYMHTRHDSLAKTTLNQVIYKYSGTGMAAKAKNTLRVLMEREKIEEYLTNLKVKRATEDSISIANGGKLQPKTAAADSVTASQKENLKPANGMLPKNKLDSAQARKAASFASAFVSAPEKPHAVALIMDNVDPVYVTETKNAFDRYNRENFYGKQFDISLLTLSDSIRIVRISGFENAGAALQYLDKASKLAGREIIPWLSENKYSFIIIDDQNLEILNGNKDIQTYRKFLSVYFPGSFPSVK